MKVVCDYRWQPPGGEGHCSLHSGHPEEGAGRTLPCLCPSTLVSAAEGTRAPSEVTGHTLTSPLCCGSCRGGHAKDKDVTQRFLQILAQSGTKRDGHGDFSNLLFLIWLFGVNCDHWFFQNLAG